LRHGYSICHTTFLIALYLIDDAIKSEVKRLFESFALVLYEEGVTGHMHLDFSYFVFECVSYVIENEVYFYIYYSVVKGAKFLHFLIDPFHKSRVSIEMHRLNLYVHMGTIW